METELSSSMANLSMKNKYKPVSGNIPLPDNPTSHREELQKTNDRVRERPRRLVATEQFQFPEPLPHKTKFLKYHVLDQIQTEIATVATSNVAINDGRA
jgi:hypothetical protein